MNEEFKEVFEKYAKHWKIYDNLPMMAAIMKALRALPNPDEQIRILDAKMPILDLAKHLASKNIDVNAIFAELRKLPSQSEETAKTDSAPSGSIAGALQGPMSRLPKFRPAPKPVGDTPINNTSVTNAAGSASNENGQPQSQPSASPRGRYSIRRTQAPRPNVGGGNNQQPDPAGQNQDVEEDKEPTTDTQASEEKEAKPNLLSKFGASFSKMFSSKEGGKTDGEPNAQNKKEPKPKTKMNPKTKSVLVAIGFVLLILVVVLVTLATASAIGKNGAGPEFPQGQSPSVPLGSDPETVLKEFELNSVVDATEPMLKKPTWESILNGSFAKDVPWNWIIWFALLSAPLLMLIQDRFAEHEETDLRMVIPGLAFMLFMVFTSPLSMFLNIQGVEPTSMIIFRGFFEKLLVAIGVLVNIAMQWSATQSGKKDYSALAFGGLFASGAIIYWWFPHIPTAAVIGWLFMIGGIALQYYEVNVSGQGMGAVIVSFIMIAAFFFGFSIGIDIISEWSVKLYDISPVMALGLYKWRIFISALIISAPIAIGIGFMAGMILLRIERSDGGSTEDSVASIAKLGEVVLYDAISLGVMIMYPLVSIVWYLSAISSALG